MDIDSLDFVRFVIHLHQILNVEIMEIDYPKLTSIQSCCEYIKAKVTETPPSPTAN
nr:hypothetical protein BdHM001_24460 [Bdellovibrio sp. HM001]